MNGVDKELNLKYIKKSRLKRGDIFALSISDKFIFGKVVNDKVSMMGGYVALIYIYDIQSSEPIVNVAQLTPDRLLVRPFLSFPSLWTKGYAIRVGSESNQTSTNLRRHRFTIAEKRYVDESGNEIEKEEGDCDCGPWRITSLGIIDDWISDALRIKRAPLHDEDIWYISGQGEKIWQKMPLSELRKYSNYNEIMNKYPEVIDHD